MLQPGRTCCGEDLGHGMPRIPRRTGHVDGISRSQSQNRTAGFVFVSDHEDAIAAKTDTDQRRVAFFADISVQAQRVSGRVEVDDGGLGCCIGEDVVQECRDVSGEIGGCFVGVHLVRPVVLASERHPTEFAVQHGLYG